MKCNDELLVQEIEKAPNEPESKVLLQHVAGCSRCQQQMAELAATVEWWEEASTVLQASPDEEQSSGFIVISLDPNTSESTTAGDAMAMDVAVDVDEVALGFLAPPSHPEMLGRMGRYEIERLIGAGGMGIVIKGFDTELHRVVAIKVLAPHLAHSGAARRRFAREAQAAAAVVHENVIPIHNVETGDKLPYLVMQYVPGSSLQARVDQDGPLSVDETLRIGTQIADGLAAAHQQGLIHRDVKPANILLEQGVDRVLISDFGLARAVDDASLTRSGIVAGTPHYMSPEQSRGTAIDCCSDLFGLGSVLYFMCTGHPPFRADGAMAVLNRICHDPHRPVFQVNNSVPLELSCLIDRMLEKSPDKRIASAEEASGALAALLASWRTPGGRRVLTRAREPARNRRKFGILATAAIILSAGALSLTYPWWTSPEPAIQPAESVTAQESLPAAFSSRAFDQELREIDAALHVLEASWSTPTKAVPAMIRDSWSETLTKLNAIATNVEASGASEDFKTNSRPIWRKP